MQYAKSRSVSENLSNTVEDDLRLHGWSLIPHAVESVEEFSTLFSRFTTKLTFDPARDYVSEVAQSVDAGTAAVGLHIENGNTPLPPDTIAFYSKKSASRGSQTTVCDGAVVLEKLGAGLRRRFEKPYSMTRHLPATIWRRYIGQALDLLEENINQAVLSKFISGIPGQSFRMRDDEGIDYTLQLHGIRSDNRAVRPAFANALLGPSFNYEAPVYRFYSGEVIEIEILEELAALCEHHTEEIGWDDGMVVLIDNKRVMHGRREILVPLSERQLCIGMGFN